MDNTSVQSAVQLPTPSSPHTALCSTNKRKRTLPSTSPSSLYRWSIGSHSDAARDESDQQQPIEEQRTRNSRSLIQPKRIQALPGKEEKQAAAKAKYDKLVNAKSGGVYIPPARLRALQAQIVDESSTQYQRMSWEALKRSINGLINKVNVSNIKQIIPELFDENLIRGRGLLCRSIMKAQAASIIFTPIYAAAIATINTKLPTIGELLIQRLVVQFKKAFKRNDKAVCTSSSTFLAHLCNHQVVHETLIAQILMLLLQNPTDDSVEISVSLMKEVGQYIEEMNTAIANLIYDRFRNILHGQNLDKRTQYMIEALFKTCKEKYRDNPAIKNGLDLVEAEDQITHLVRLDEDLQDQTPLGVFEFDPQWEVNEETYRKIKAEILGEGTESDEESVERSTSSDEEIKRERATEIKDESNQALINLRRTIYLTIMSSQDFESCTHKLLRLELGGEEPEVPSMIVECCSQERTYIKFYGSIGERLSKLQSRPWAELFETSFMHYYEIIHRFETNKLRNIAKLFSYLLSSEAISWHVLSTIHLNESETTSSSRIFVKILMLGLVENMGMSKLQELLQDQTMQTSFEGIFPRDNARNIRFSINYFTSIGMGAITEDMRQRLKSMPKTTTPAMEEDSETVSSYSSYTSSSRSDSCSPSSERGRSRRHYRGR
ncbi:pre-mRNA-splicing factor cwc22 [Thelotrema lepadinum]|nr:pre-mRNA-splicing factor cwc22 [Thelotrema lepadinum]